MTSHKMANPHSPVANSQMKVRKSAGHEKPAFIALYPLIGCLYMRKVLMVFFLCYEVISIDKYAAVLPIIDGICYFSITLYTFSKLLQTTNFILLLCL